MGLIRMTISIGLAGAATLAVVGATAASSWATSTTTLQAQTLAAAESHVVTLLHNFKPSAGWRAAFSAAVAAKGIDATDLTYFLAMLTTSPSWLSASGNLDATFRQQLVWVTPFWPVARWISQ